MPTVSGLEHVYRLVKPQMEGLDRVLAETFTAGAPCVDEMLQYASRYSGKRLRPALVFLIGKLTGRVDEAHVKLGAVVEMIHLATLVHDDVLDRATVRHSAASVNTRWNNKDAILLGDIIFARAIRLLVSIGSMRALDLLTGAVSTICEGEIQQNQLCGEPDLDEATYLDIIQRKTASLYGAGCELACLLADGSEEQCRAFSEFGYALGTAFQIIDDCLDISGDEGVVGKSLGTDVLNGKMTLPMIHLLARLDGAEREEIEAIVRGQVGRAGAIERVRDLLATHDSLSYALGRAGQYVDQSLSRLRDLLDAPSFAIVEDIAGFVLNRQR